MKSMLQMLQISNIWQYWHARNPDVFHLLRGCCEKKISYCLWHWSHQCACQCTLGNRFWLNFWLLKGSCHRNEYRLIMWSLHCLCIVHCQNCKDGKLWFMPWRRKWRTLEQPRSFTWQKLMNWLREFKEKLLSSLAFYRIIYLIPFNAGKLSKYELFACWQQRWKFKDLKFASNCYKNESKAFLHKTKTAEKTWIHHSDPGKSNNPRNSIIKIHLQKENENPGLNRKIHFVDNGRQVVLFT